MIWYIRSALRLFPTFMIAMPSFAGAGHNRDDSRSVIKARLLWDYEPPLGYHQSRSVPLPLPPSALLFDVIKAEIKGAFVCARALTSTPLSSKTQACEAGCGYVILFEKIIYHTVTQPQTTSICLSCLPFPAKKCNEEMRMCSGECNAMKFILLLHCGLHSASSLSCSLLLKLGLSSLLMLSSRFWPVFTI